MFMNQCQVIVSANQVDMLGCTEEEVSFIQEFVRVIDADICNGLRPDDYLELVDWDKVLFRAARIQAIEAGKVPPASPEEAQMADQFSAYKVGFAAENEPIEGPTQGFAVPGIVWLVAIVIAVAFALNQRAPQAPAQLKERINQWLEIIKNQAKDWMPK
jgi:hypothetical protein